MVFYLFLQIADSFLVFFNIIDLYFLLQQLYFVFVLSLSRLILSNSASEPFDLILIVFSFPLPFRFHLLGVLLHAHLARIKFNVEVYIPLYLLIFYSLLLAQTFI